MAGEVKWLRAAADDLDAIAAYIASDSPTYASAVVEKVLDVAAGLREFPLLGRAVPEWNDDRIRERVVYSYRLIYGVYDEAIVVLAVIHGARLLPDELGERMP